MIFVASIFALNQNDQVITREFESFLRNQDLTWEVADYEENIFKGWTVSDMKSILSSKNLGKHPSNEITSDLPGDVPQNFDGRKQWPTCFHSIRDQGDCGSCWAFGLSEMMSTRYCVQCKKPVELSPQDFVSCDKKDQGCDGGDFDVALEYATKTGIVTDKCFPYSSGSGYVPRCETECKHKEDPFLKYKCKEGTAKNYGPNRDAIKNAIYNFGTTSGGFRVYRDFLYYKNGIYMHREGEYLGDHAIHTIGWGHGGGIDYWICANSWGTSWGWQGTFMIMMGECDIDKDQWACDMAC